MSTLAAAAVAALTAAVLLAGSPAREAQAFPLVYGSCTSGPGTTWGAPTPTAFSGSSYGISTGRFDADANLDVLVDQSGGMPMRPFAGTGNGMLTPLATLAGNATTQSAAGDLDGDGDDDVVSSNGSAIAYVHKSNGNGTFASAVSYPLATSGSGGGQVELGDIDGDGDLDVAVSNYQGPTSIFRNTGNGTLTGRTEYTMAPYSHFAILLDYDGDGDLDLSTPGWDGIYYRTNSGTGAFGGLVSVTPSTSIGYYGYTDKGDFNADGKADIFIFWHGSAAPTVFLGTSSGFNATPVTPTDAQNTSAVEAADFNNDGFDDIATLRSTGSGPFYVDLYFASGASSFCPRRTIAASQTGQYKGTVGAGDLDSDGRQDLLVTHDPGITTIINTSDRGAPVNGTPTGTLYTSRDRWLNGASYTLNYSASDSGGSGVVLLELYVDGVLKKSKPVDCPGGGCSISDSFTFVPAEYSDGSHAVRITSRDSAGNPASTTFDAAVERSRPTVAVEHDPPAGWTAASSHSVRVIGTDADSGIRRLTVHEPGAAAQSHEPGCTDLVTPACPKPTAQHDFTYGASLADGVHSLRATAENAVLDESEPDASWTLEVDRGDPAQTQIGGSLFAQQQAGGSVARDDYTVTADMSDAYSGVKSWEVKLDGAVIGSGSHTCSTTTQCPTAPATKSFDIDTRPLGFGEHTVAVKVVDAVGKERTDSKTFLMAEGVKPTVSVSGSATVAVNPGTGLRITANDTVEGTAGSGIRRVEVKIDGQIVKTFLRVCPCGQLWDPDDATTPLVYDIDPSLYSEGEHTIEVVAWDSAGNPSEIVDDVSRFVVYVTQLGAIDRLKLGLEDFFHYESTPTGAGSRVHVNAATGNVIWHSVPVVNTGRGLSSVVNLTYNSHDRGGFLSQMVNDNASPVLGATLQDLIGLAYGEAGHGFSLGISGVTRLNEPLGGALAAAVSQTATDIVLTDPDGSAHRFEPTNVLTGVYKHPPGVYLHLRRFTNASDLTSKKYWAMTRPDGVTFFFDAAGYATSVEDRNGNVIRFDYETYSKVDSDLACPSTDPLPEVVCAKRVIRVVDPAGVDAGSDTGTRDARSLHITYREEDVLSLPEDIDPSQVPSLLSHVGGDVGRIASIRDHAGRLTEFTYDDDGYLVELTQGKLAGASSNPDERSFELGYTGEDQNRVLHTIEDPNGQTTTIDYESLDEPGPVLTSRSVGRRVTATTDRRGAKKDYAFGARPPATPGTTFTLTDPPLAGSTARRVRAAALDASARPVELVDGRGTKTELKWDEDAPPAEPVRNNVSTIIRAAETPDAASTSMTYNEHGQLTSRTDAEQRLTTLAYTASTGAFIAPTGVDAGKSLVSDLDVLTPPRLNETDFTTDAAGNVTARKVEGQPAATFAYGPRGVLTSQTDEAGNTIEFEQYDHNGLPRREIDARDQVWTYEYDAVGNLLKGTDPRGVATSDPVDFATRVTYDALDRPTAVTVPKRSAANAFITRTRSYDDNGNMIEEIDGLGRSHRFGFSVMDEKTRVESPPVEHFGESGSAREVTTSEYDSIGRLVKSVAPNGEGGSDGDFETTFEYSAADELLVERRKARAHDANTPKELVTSRAYDRRGNVVGVADAKRNAGANAAALAADPSARRWTYGYDDTDNRVEAIEDPGDKKLTTRFVYDANQNLEKQTSPRGVAENNVSGFTATFGRDTNDLITSIKIGDRLTTFERRGDGRILRKVAPRGNLSETPPGHFATTYEYLPTGELERYTLPRAPGQYGDAASVTYGRNEVGDPTSITDARGVTFGNSFYDTGELRSTARPSWWKHVTGTGEASEDATDELDPASAERTAAFEMRLRSYDELLHEAPGGDLPDATGAGDLGPVDRAPMADLVPRAGSTQFDYDNEMRLTAITDAAGAMTELRRDAVGRVFEERRALEGTTKLTTSYQFDRNGNVRAVTDPDLQRTVRQYDEYNRLTVEDAPGASQEAAGVDGTGTVTRARTQHRYDANGNIVDLVSPRGTRTRSAYDSVDRLVSSEAADTGATTYGYDANGNMTSQRRPLGNKTPVNDEFMTRFTYNQFDELATRVDGLDQTTTYSYDANGNQTRVVAPGAGPEPEDGAADLEIDRQFDGRDLLWTERTGASGGTFRTTVTEFDGNGFPRRTVHPAGVDDATRRPVLGDGGATPPAADATRNATVHRYDDDGLLTDEWLPHGGGSDPRYRRTLGYDGRGRVTSILAPYVEAGQRTTRTAYERYDTGWIKKSIDQFYAPGATTPTDRTTNEYRYDGRGNQVLWFSSSGREVRRSYYPNNQLRQRTAKKTPTDVTPRTYTYGYNENRSLSQVIDWDLSRRTNIRRDQVERVTLVQEDWGGGKDTQYEYDVNGRVTTRRTDGKLDPEPAPGQPPYTGGKTTTFTYDALDRELTTVVDPLRHPEQEHRTRTTSTAYWPSGAMRTRTKSNGTVERWGYFDDGRVRTQHRDPEDGETQIRTYSYDRDGNRTTDHGGSYEYNARKQLVRWDPVGPSSTDYEMNGSGTVTAITRDGERTERELDGDRLRRERVNGDVVAEYNYDGNGNVDDVTEFDEEHPAGVTTDYDYDEFGRMTYVDGGGTGGEDDAHEYQYDGFDRREWVCDNGLAGSRTCEGGRRLDLTYIGVGEQLSREQRPSGEQAVNFDYDSRLKVLGHESEPSEDALRAYTTYTTDPNGSVRGLENDDGVIGTNDRFDYDPFGRILNEDTLSPTAQASPIRFEGFYYDAASRTYDMHARPYLPSAGRFLTEDRYEAAMADFDLQADPLTQDRYAFAGGNPVNNIEWDGHEGVDPRDARSALGSIANIRLCHFETRVHDNTWIRPGKAGRIAWSAIASCLHNRENRKSRPYFITSLKLTVTIRGPDGNVYDKDEAPVVKWPNKQNKSNHPRVAASEPLGFKCKRGEKYTMVARVNIEGIANFFAPFLPKEPEQESIEWDGWARCPSRDERLPDRPRATDRRL